MDIVSNLWEYCKRTTEKMSNNTFHQPNTLAWIIPLKHFGDSIQRFYERIPLFLWLSYFLWKHEWQGNSCVTIFSRCGKHWGYVLLIGILWCGKQRGFVLLIGILCQDLNNSLIQNYNIWTYLIMLRTYQLFYFCRISTLNPNASNNKHENWFVLLTATQPKNVWQ